MGIFDKLLGKKEPEFDFDALTKHELDRDPFRPASDPLTSSFSNPADPFDQPAQTFANSSMHPSLTRPPLQEPTHFETPPRFTPTSQNPQSGYGRDKELELINSKLDTIKAMLNTMEQRLNSLEQPPSQQQRPRW